jgi:hypothetical protein
MQTAEHQNPPARGRPGAHSSHRRRPSLALRVGVRTRSRSAPSRSTAAGGGNAFSYRNRGNVLAPRRPLAWTPHCRLRRHLHPLPKSPARAALGLLAGRPLAWTPHRRLRRHLPHKWGGVSAGALSRGLLCRNQRGGIIGMYRNRRRGLPLGLFAWSVACALPAVCRAGVGVETNAAGGRGEAPAGSCQKAATFCRCTNCAQGSRTVWRDLGLRLGFWPKTAVWHISRPERPVRTLDEPRGDSLFQERRRHRRRVSGAATQ